MDRTDFTDRPDYSEFSEYSDYGERPQRMDRAEHADRTVRSEQRDQIRRRPPVRTGGKPKAKINYRMLLCIAVLVSLVLALLFFILFMVRGSTIKGLNEKLDALGKEKDTISAQVTALTQENQSMLTSLAASLPDPKTAATDSLPDLIPQLTEGVYVIYSTGSQYQYLSVPAGFLQDKLAAYRDDAAAYQPAEGDAPLCTYYVLFSDRVIGLAQGNTGFVSTNRTATGAATSVPAGFMDFVASFFA